MEGLTYCLIAGGHVVQPTIASAQDSIEYLVHEAWNEALL